MFDPETTARLRAIFDEVCAGMSDQTAVRAYVASKMLEAAARGEISVEGLRTAGLQALIDCRENGVPS